MDAYLDLSGPNSYPPPEGKSTPVNIPASRFLRSYSRKFSLFEGLRAYRITSAMERAARNGQIYHLWWHPKQFGIHLAENLAFLETILVKYKELERHLGMRSLNMGEIAHFAAEFQ